MTTVYPATSSAQRIAHLETIMNVILVVGLNHSSNDKLVSTSKSALKPEWWQIDEELL